MRIIPEKVKPYWDLFIKFWMIYGIGIVIALAYKFPDVGRSGGVIRSEYSVSYAVVAIIFFISGLSMKTKTLVSMGSRWRAHLVVQSLSFLVTPAIIFGFVEAIRKADNPAIDPYTLVGMIITGCTPTTISSNVVMTKAANGNDALALIEVTIGNIMGAFVTPALVQMYLSNKTGFGFANPSKGSSVTALYGRVMKQLGCSLFVPLFVGQVVQNIFPKQTAWAVSHLYLGKIGSLCLLALIWATFSTSFYQKAFEVTPHQSIIMVCFFNFGIYLFFTVLCFIAARTPFHKLLSKPQEHHSKVYHVFYRIMIPFCMSKEDTIAVMLCGAAKTVALGVPLIESQYGTGSQYVGLVSIPLVLYQGQQIMVAQFLIPIMKWWVRKDKPKAVESDVEESFGDKGENQLTNESVRHQSESNIDTDDKTDEASESSTHYEKTSHDRIN